MPSLLDSPRFKVATSAGIAAWVALGCALLAQRAVSYERGVRGSALYVAGDPVASYPLLVSASRAGWLGRLNAAPLLDLAEVATWAIDDPRFVRYHREMAPGIAARLAFEAYAEALRRRPTASRALAGLADLFRRLRILRLKRAVPSLGELVPPGRAAPREPEAEDRLVEAAYRKAIEMEPANYFWHAYLADFLEERGRRNEAMPLYAKAIELMPDLSWHYYLGEAGPLPADLFDAALTGLTRALETSVVVPAAKIEFNLGWLHDRQRNLVAALQHYRRAVELAADPSRYLYHAAVVLTRLKRPDGALEYFRRSLARGTLNERQRITALTQIGRILMRRGQDAAAVESLAGARNLDPGSYAVRLELGRAYEGLGRIDEAEAEYRQALILDPSRAEIYTALIDLYRRQRDYARAIPLARRLVEMFPDDPNMRAQLDGLYRQMAGAHPPG